jgi:hypothetical protein
MQLKSSRIKSAEYNDSTGVLTVEFYKGGKYKYYSVPETVYQGLIRSSSPGNYFDLAIKGKYTYRKD